jgi:hypothetical protein
MVATKPTDIQKDLAPVFAFSQSTLDAKRAQIAEANQIVARLAVSDAVSLAEANEWLQLIVQEKDAIEDMRTSVTKPLNATLKQINSWFKPIADLCAKAESNLKHEIGRYAAAERQKQQLAFQAASLAHSAGAHTAARTALAVASSAETQTPQGTSVREVWRAEIINPAAVPPAFLIPNEPAIQAHARTTPVDVAPVPIAGVRFYKDQIVTVRRA